MSLLVTISVRFTYSIQENTFIDWQQFSAQHQRQLEVQTNNLLDVEEEQDENEFFPKIKTLPFGSVQDCIE